MLCDSVRSGFLIVNSCVKVVLGTFPGFHREDYFTLNRIALNRF
jgi:hypothetical protein